MKVKIGLLMVIGYLIMAVAGCGMFDSSPASVVKKFNQLVQDGEINAAMKMMSGRAIRTLGEDKMRRALEASTKEIKKKGGVKELKITKEEITGDLAEVEGTVIYGNGSTSNDIAKLIKENNEWKIDLKK